MTYTSIVGVRYDMLCKLLDRKWKIGTYTLEGIDGLVGGFQLVHWYRLQKYYQYSCNCDLRAVIEPLLQQLRSTHSEGSLLIMSASIDDRDSVRKWDLAQDKLIAINSVAFSAGSTATMAVLVESATGHLNGWPSYPFDQEKCYARATVARSRSSTVMVMGIMGMVQVLSARAHPIEKVRPGARRCPYWPWLCRRHLLLRRRKGAASPTGDPSKIVVFTMVFAFSLFSILWLRMG